MHILIADDEHIFSAEIEEIVAEQGLSYYTVHNPDDALAHLREHHAQVSLALLDVQFKNHPLTGLDVLAQARKLYPRIPVVMISGKSTFDDVRQATQIGAVNFIPKDGIVRQRVREVINAEMQKFSAQLSEAETLAFMKKNGLIGRSKAMMHIASLVRKYGKTELSVLITGETGTGKKVVAHALHAASQRANKPFITADMTNIPSELFQSELFGAVKGAYSGATENKIGLFQTADKGTLFLDEIGDLPPGDQSRLLLPVEEKRVRRVGSTAYESADARIISATDKNLPELIRESKFNAPLYSRLRECEITIPPLRERREDIPPIAEYYLRQHNEKFRERKFLTPSALEYLQSRAWPGNVRELEQTLRRVLQTTDHDRMDAQDFAQESNDNSMTTTYHQAQHPSPQARYDAPSAQNENAQNETARIPLGGATAESLSGGQMGGSVKNIRESTEELKKKQLIEALTKTNGNITQATKILDVSRETIHTWMRKYGVTREQFKNAH
jgi:DNA-binding NtrC family response regulator